jgi:hypothetical protein
MPFISLLLRKLDLVRRFWSPSWIGARVADNATLNDVYKKKKIDGYKKKKKLRPPAPILFQTNDEKQKYWDYNVLYPIPAVVLYCIVCIY